MRKQLLFILTILCITSSRLFSQGVQTDTIANQLSQVPSKYFNEISSKADKYFKEVTSKTEKTLEKLVKWEEKIKSLLEKINPEAAAKLFSNSQVTFKSLLQKYKEGVVATEGYILSYDQYRDKLNTTLKYLDEKKQKLNATAIKPLETAREKVGKLNEQLANTEALQKLIKERKKLLMQQAAQYLGQSKYLQKINKQAFYYFEALRNYKQVFSDSKKAEELALKLLKKIPAFNDFMEKNSLLASLFGSPGLAGNPNGTIGLLQSRAMVQASLLRQVGGAGSSLPAGQVGTQQAIQQAMQIAQGQLNQLKQEVAKFGGAGSDFDIPDFKPNSQRSKKFLQKIELAANIQSTRHNSGFPLSSDIGFSVGFKPNDRIISGLGGSYRVGWGTSFSNIRISHQGVGIRSFLDWRIKGGFYLSTGYEQNYFSEIRNIAQLREYSAWKSSALAGVSKKYNVGKKKKGEMKILYDFLSQTKIPKTSSILFRVGFGL